MEPDYTINKRKGAIVFLDILGFKGIWNRRKPEEILETIKDIHEIIFNYYRNIINFKEGDQRYGLNTIDIITLSDTIVIEADGDNFVYLMADLSFIIQNIFLVFLKRNLPLRGAVSFGEYYRMDKVFMGPAVDDAAEWHEKVNWIGVVLTPDTTAYLDSEIHNKEYIRFKNQRISKNYYWLKYPVQCKNSIGEKELYAINWTSPAESFIEGRNKNSGNNILKWLSSARQGNNEPSVVDKYENTVRFVEKCLKLKEKLNFCESETEKRKN